MILGKYLFGALLLLIFDYFDYLFCSRWNLWVMFFFFTSSMVFLIISNKVIASGSPVSKVSQRRLSIRTLPGFQPQTKACRKMSLNSERSTAG